MNILLINVSLRPNSPVVLFPVGLGYIATAMKNAGFKFDLLDIDAKRYSDQQVIEIIRSKKYDVVCIGCIVTGYKMVKELATIIKEYHPDSKIIVGNSVATSIVDTLLNRTQVDIAVMSEGDITIVELLETISRDGDLEDVAGISFRKDGKIVITRPRPPIKDISSLPFIDFSIFETEIYIKNSKEYVNEPLPLPRDTIRALPVNTARGCVANCTFCYHNFRGLPYRYRTAESIIAEIKALVSQYSLNYIHFWDELTFFNKKHTLQFAEQVIESGLNFYWRANCRADLFNDDDDVEIMKKMKEAGCIGMTYSLETADSQILKEMNKHITTEQFSKQTKLFHSAGIPVWTSLVFGYPQETPDTIKKTFDCCIENMIYPSSGYLLPQPGSKMYDYARENGYILEEEEYLLKMGDRQDLRLNMTRMGDQQFEECVMDGLKRCNEDLKMGLKMEQLMKTQYYRGKKVEN